MATKNKTAVMAYLTPELESFVADYCKTHELSFTTKEGTKPRLGTGIVRMLDDLRLGNKTFAESNTIKESPPLPDIEKLVKEQVKAAIANLNQPDQKELIKEQVKEVIDRLPKSEPVDIDAQVSKAVNEAIAALPKPDPVNIAKLTPEELEKLAWSVVEVLTDDQKK